MKRIRVSQFGGPEVLKLEQADDPRPGPGQVLVAIKAVGVNPVETYIRAGTYSHMPQLPYTPGNDGAGVIESVGEGVTRVKPGDRVFVSGSLSGTYAEKALCTDAQVFPLPDPLSFSQGAAVGIPYATAYRGLVQRARALPGETVLVHGASGGVGTAAVQLARNAGMIAIGTAGSEAGRRHVLEQGATHVLDHTKAGYLDEVMKLTGGRGVDVVLEMLANVNLGRDLTVLAPFGRVVIIGSRGTVEMNPRDMMNRDSEILGMRLYNASPAEFASMHAAIAAGLAHGTLRPVVGKEMPLAEAPRAHVEVIEGKSLGKLVLVT